MRSRVFTKVLTGEITHFRKGALQKIKGSVTPQVRGGFSPRTTAPASGPFDTAENHSLIGVDLSGYDLS